MTSFTLSISTNAIIKPGNVLECDPTFGPTLARLVEESINAQGASRANATLFGSCTVNTDGAAAYAFIVTFFVSVSAHLELVTSNE